MIERCALALGGWIGIVCGSGQLAFAYDPETAAPLKWLVAHWVHIDVRHSLTNAAGWSLAVFGLGLSTRAICILTAAASLTISTFWYAWGEAAYAGLSGVLYALVAAALMGREWRLALLGLSVLAVSAGLGFSRAYSNYEIAYSAHYVGLAVGVLWGFVKSGMQRDAASYRNASAASAQRSR